MKKLIEKYESQIVKCKLSIDHMFKMIDAGEDEGGEAIDTDDLLEEIEIAKSRRRMYETFIHDIKNSDVMIILDYLVDNNEQFGTDSSKRRILRVEQSMFDRITDITKNVK